MARLQVALVGCGGRGRRAHLGTVSQFDDVEVVAVCDPSKDARDAVGDQYGIAHRYASVEELLDRESLDAVFVAPPAYRNAEAALPCLERGVNTLLEKPPGLSVAETMALREAARRTGAKVMIGWDRRFVPIMREARRMVEARGPIVQIVSDYHKSMTQIIASRRFPEHMLDNMVYEAPIHAIDIVRATAGADVAEVHSLVRRAFSPYKDVHGALVLFDNGCVANFIFNYTTDARLERYEIHGRDTSAYVEGVNQAVVLADGVRRDLGDLGTNGTLLQNRYFLDCVKEDRPITLPAADLDEAVKTMELAEAILAGLRPERAGL